MAFTVSSQRMAPIGTLTTSDHQRICNHTDTHTPNLPNEVTGYSKVNQSSLKNPRQAPSAVGDSGTALKDDHPIARIQARKNA
ncbi:hypothetical protein, partial [Xanthomonas fragariae]